MKKLNPLNDSDVKLAMSLINLVFPKLPKFKHGWCGYTKFGCRCAICKAGNVAHTQKYLAKPGNRLKHLARKAVGHAIANRRLSPQRCAVCNRVHAVAHHHKGYAKKNWLNVTWLCKKHHIAAHKAAK